MAKGFKNPAGNFQPIKDHKKGTKMKQGKSIKPTGFRLPSLRKKRETKQLPNEIVERLKEDFNGSDVEVASYNPKWKLYEVYVDEQRFYLFPDEESALEFGRQTIRDTASEYIPDEGTEDYDEWKNLEGEDLVDKIIEVQSDYGQRSQLGAIAKSVASYDGQYHELPDGWIAFGID